MPKNSAQQWSASFLASLTREERKAFLATLSPQELKSLQYDWSFWARPEQRAPAGNWHTWLILAGRGAGKTRSGAEWIRACACGATPLTGGSYSRIALVAETAADARDVMVEGPSGLLAIHPPALRPRFEPSKRRLT
jgi:phage terminase large subunit-like protein